MSPTCKASGCNNRKNKTPEGNSISYFRFPRQQARFDEWVRRLEVCLDKEVKPEDVNRNWKVCQFHFDPSMFVKFREGSLNLKSDAVPMLRWYNAEPQLGTPLLKNGPGPTPSPSFGQGGSSVGQPLQFLVISKEVHEAKVAELKKVITELKKKHRLDIYNLKVKLEKAERREEKLKIELKEVEITEEIIDRKFQRHRQIADMVKLKLIPRKKLKTPIPSKKQKLQGWMDAIESAVVKSINPEGQGDAGENIEITTTGVLNSKEGCGHLYHDTIAMVAAGGHRDSGISSCSSFEIVSATSVSPAPRVIGGTDSKTKAEINTDSVPTSPTPTHDDDGNLLAQAMGDKCHEMKAEVNTDTIEIPSDLKFLITIPPQSH